MQQISQAMNALDNAIRNISVESSTMRVYHYASSKELKGIFDKDLPALPFWQYDLQDKEKGLSDFFEILHKYCHQQLLNKRMSRELYDKIMSIKASDLFYGILMPNEKTSFDNGNVCEHNADFYYGDCYTYVCSFSKNNDSLPMWEMCSKSEYHESFCLGLHSRTFLNQNCCGEGFHISLKEVIYDDLKKIALIDSVLSPIMSKYSSASADYKAVILSIVKKMIGELVFAYKNKSFSDEEEIRAVLHIPKGLTTNVEKISERKCMHSNGVNVPYVEYQIEKSSVFNITIAPTIKEDMAVSNLKDYLCSNNLDHIDIIKSELPIRAIL